MPYRIFCLDREGLILHAELLKATEDAEAVREAYSVPQDAVTCEVWDIDRLVVRFDGRNGGLIQPK